MSRIVVIYNRDKMSNGDNLSIPSIREFIKKWRCAHQYYDRTLAEIGITKLGIAAIRGCVGGVKLILQQENVDINLGWDHTNESPLYLASRYNHVSVVKLLLKRGADPNKLREDGSSPLLVALDHADLKIAKLLISAGADVSGTTGTNFLLVALKRADFELAKLLITKGANIDGTVGTDNPLLYHMANSYSFDQVKFLLDMGADPTIKNKNNYTTLESTLARLNWCTHNLSRFIGSENFVQHYETDVRLIDLLRNYTPSMQVLSQRSIIRCKVNVSSLPSVFRP